MSRCPNCPGDNRCVPADGPEGCEYIFIGEAPGSVEDKMGKPFMGKTGEEFNRNYLPLAGLKRGNVRILNSISCLPPGPKGKLDPKKKSHTQLLESCFNHHVRPELECNSYRVIVPMGSFACKAIDASIDLELQHGIPCNTQYGATFPMYHPAGGLHEPKKMLLIRTDWVRLKRYLSGKLRIAQDKYTKPDYRLLTTREELDEELSVENAGYMAIDTETMRGGSPFCLTFSCRPGSGYMILAGNKLL
jgi:DNA polymerase